MVCFPGFLFCLGIVRSTFFVIFSLFIDVVVCHTSKVSLIIIMVSQVFDTQQDPGSKVFFGERALPDNLDNTRRFLRVSGILKCFILVISVRPKIR